jgi:hypothetical protein
MTINRLGKLNTLCPEVLQAMSAAITRAHARPVDHSDYRAATVGDGPRSQIQEIFFRCHSLALGQPLREPLHCRWQYGKVISGTEYPLTCSAQHHNMD